MEIQDGSKEIDSDSALDVNIYIINGPKPKAHFIFTNDGLYLKRKYNLQSHLAQSRKKCLDHEQALMAQKPYI